MIGLYGLFTYKKPKGPFGYLPYKKPFGKVIDIQPFSSKQRKRDFTMKTCFIMIAGSGVGSVVGSGDLAGTG